MLKSKSSSVNIKNTLVITPSNLYLCVSLFSTIATMMMIITNTIMSTELTVTLLLLLTRFVTANIVKLYYNNTNMLPLHMLYSVVEHKRFSMIHVYVCVCLHIGLCMCI